MKHKAKLIKWWLFDREQYRKCVVAWMHLEQCRKRYEKAVKGHRARKHLLYDYQNARVDYEYAVRGV